MAVLDLARLKHVRKLRGFRQQEISERLGISDTSYGQWERGTREPTLSNLAALARLLEVPMGYLLGEGRAGALHDLGDHRGDYVAAIDSREAARRLAGASPGLRDLAEDEALCTALAITAEEWLMLASLALPAPMGKPGYVAVLAVVRGQLQG